jgi:hypothetical protein
MLKQRLLSRPGFGSGGVLRPDSSFTELADLWWPTSTCGISPKATKDGYRDQLRLHVRPALEHYTLAEITTGRVEWFLKSQSALSYSRGRQSRTLLNLMFEAPRFSAVPIRGAALG